MFASALLLIITSSNIPNMDSTEIIYATVEEIIGKTGKWHSTELF